MSSATFSLFSVFTSDLFWSKVALLMLYSYSNQNVEYVHPLPCLISKSFLSPYAFITHPVVCQCIHKKCITLVLYAKPVENASLFVTKFLTFIIFCD